MSAGWNSINIGPRELVLGSASLGLTKGGCKFNYKIETTKTVADVTGKTARQEIVIAQECNVAATMTEMSIEQLTAVLVGAESEGDGLAVKMVIGLDLVGETATPLYLKPIVNGVASTDESTWIVLPKCSVKANLSTPLELENQQVYEVLFDAHPNSENGKDILFRIGSTGA